MKAGERRYRERCIEKVGYRFRGDERLLDVGCGDGGVSRLLHERVREVVAIDLEPAGQWHDERGLSFLVADAEQLPLAAAEFDLVHSKDSLHHMNDPHRALREYHRVLRPRGTAIIIEGNRFNPSFYLHLTKLCGHEHFSQAQFRSLVSSVFDRPCFRVFEAHYVPGAERFIRLQNAVEDLLERIPLYPPSYNVAVADRRNARAG